MYLTIILVTMNPSGRASRNRMYMGELALFVSLLHYTYTLGGCSVAEHWWLNQEALVCLLAAPPAFLSLGISKVYGHYWPGLCL